MHKGSDRKRIQEKARTDLMWTHACKSTLQQIKLATRVLVSMNENARSEGGHWSGTCPHENDISFKLSPGGFCPGTGLSLTRHPEINRNRPLHPRSPKKKKNYPSPTHYQYQYHPIMTGHRERGLSGFMPGKNPHSWVFRTSTHEVTFCGLYVSEDILALQCVRYLSLISANLYVSANIITVKYLILCLNGESKERESWKL